MTRDQLYRSTDTTYTTYTTDITDITDTIDTIDITDTTDTIDLTDLTDVWCPAGPCCVRCALGRWKVLWLQRLPPIRGVKCGWEWMAQELNFIYLTSLTPHVPQVWGPTGHDPTLWF